MECKKKILSFLFIQLCSSAIGEELNKSGCCPTSPPAKSTFFASGEYLRWRPNEDGLAYLVLVNNDSLPLQLGEQRFPDFQWDNGFRVGAGCRFPHDQWEIGAKWSQFFSMAKGKTTDSGDNFLFPQWTNSVVVDGSLTNPITEGEGKWILRLFIIDGELGRKVNMTPSIALRPHIGVRGAWIDQRYLLHYEGGISNSTLAAAPVLQDNLDMKNDFKGAGLRSGVDSNWCIGSGWSIYSNLAASLLYSTFSLHGKEVQSTILTPSLTPIALLKDTINQVSFMLDLAAGIEWQYLFSNQRTCIYLSAGWEFNDFFDQNKLSVPIFVPDIPTGTQGVTLNAVGKHEDLTTQGFVASARVDF